MLEIQYRFSGRRFSRWSKVLRARFVAVSPLNCRWLKSVSFEKPKSPDFFHPKFKLFIDENSNRNKMASTIKICKCSSLLSFCQWPEQSKTVLVKCIQIPPHFDEHAIILSFVTWYATNLHFDTICFVACAVRTQYAKECQNNTITSLDFYSCKTQKVTHSQ